MIDTFADGEALSQAAAQLFAEAARKNVAGRGRFFVDADVPELRRQIGKDIRLAGRRILP